MKENWGGNCQRKGPSFDSSFRIPGGEEVGERGADLAQLPHMGDVAGTFDGEDKGRGGCGGPLFVVRGTLQGIEAAVDFDGGKGGCGERQFFALRELFRIKKMPRQPLHLQPEIPMRTLPEMLTVGWRRGEATRLHLSGVLREMRQTELNSLHDVHGHRIV